MNDEIVKQFLDNPVEGRLALSASLKNFIAFFFWYMYRQQFIFRPFHNLIIKKLEDIAFGRAEKKNLIINLPPRMGKSAVCQMFGGWCYMLNPHSNCIYTSYSDDLTSSFSKDIRSMVESDAFKTLTGIKLNKAKSGADYWATTIGGGFRAASMGGSITGFGAGVSGNDFGGCMIIDDPNKASSVKSQAELQNTVDYYNNTLKSRLNNQAKTPIILIMQRLALEDLTGYLLENEADDWDIIKLQGLNEETGEALWEEKYPAAELLKLKKVNPFVYYGQYQQEPIVVGGSVIKTEWFRFYDPKDTYDYQFTFITSDTAQKKGEANDFSVFSFWGKTLDNRLHLLDKVKGKWEADELRQQVKLCWEKWKKFKTPPYGFYIEDKSSGIGVIQEIKKTEPIPIIPIARSRYKNEQGMMVAADKFSRVMTTAPYLANGWVYLPNSEKDDISSSLLAECAAFRADLSHKHDDEVDTLCDAVDIAFGSTGISSIFI
jgi:predicted phage terminase large subunit-like protein